MECCGGRGLGEPPHVPSLAGQHELVNEFRGGDGVANPKTREAIDLREGAQHDKRPVISVPDKGDHALVPGIGHVLRVGLVDGWDDGGGRERMNAASSLPDRIVPVGLLGLTTMTSLVLSLTASRMAARSKR